MTHGRGAGLVGLDARAKLVAAALLLVAALAAGSIAGRVTLGILVATMLAASRVDPRTVGTLLRPVGMVVVAIVLAQVLLGTSHAVELTPGRSIDAPLLVAAARAVQVLDVALVAIALTATTPAVRMARALGQLAAPLRPLRVPVDELATTSALALGLLPATADEARRIELALRARGLDAAELSLGARLRMRRIALTALAVAAFRRSRTLADALAIRGFHPSVRQASLAVERSTPADVGLVLVCAAIAAAALGGFA